ncbi:MAG: hypothetical protein LBR45_03820 [Bacteroidales bacterium]|jgi:hypothetical protein|nr:hypothetical protein [Bacteroidales bacterium]
MTDIEIEAQEKLKAKIKDLNETLWDYKALQPNLEKWLANFSNEKEQFHALYLLSKFMFFGDVPMKKLLKSLYRDLYRYPIIDNIRRNNGNTLDKDFIESAFKIEENNTRFLGVGNPSESGAHLLYHFRQENNLPNELFVDITTISTASKQLSSSSVTQYIFIDDFCGSGSQATNEQNKRTVECLKQLSSDAKVAYLMLFATSNGINKIRDSGLYDRVEAVIELDNTYKCFDAKSRFFPDKDGFLFEKNFTQEFCFRLGKPLIYSVLEQEGFTGNKEKYSNDAALGWGDCQLLLGFNHNTPNNTLPIIWCDEDNTNWHPIFKRYNKKYSL